MNIQLPPPHELLIGTATSAFQVEGGLDGLSDYGLYASISGGEFREAAGGACHHYELFESDLELLKSLGFDSYRFGIEWARIEPEMGKIDKDALTHYRCVLQVCRELEIVPVVTLHHFSSPRWLISNGGWESLDTPGYFARYAKIIVEEMGGLILGDSTHPSGYICTLNEINTGALNATDHGDPTVRAQKPAWMKACHALGVAPEKFRPWQFASSDAAIEVILSSHAAAIATIHDAHNELQVGLTVASQDIVAADLSEPDNVDAALAQMWWREDRFWDGLKKHYGTCVDFVGVQSYEHLRVGYLVNGTYGILPPDINARKVALGYEWAPHALAACIRHTHAELPHIPILITEFGIGGNDDDERIEYYKAGIAEVVGCIDSGIPVKGFFAWSALDNFEWEHGYRSRFGVIDVDYQTQARTPKPSAAFLGGEVAQKRQYDL